MKKLIQEWYPLFLILLVGGALRFHLLFVRGTLWFDELFSVHFSSIPSWRETIHYWILETNPPLYTLFLRFYLLLVPNRIEWLVRLPSVLFGLMAIVLLYSYAKRRFDRATAIVASLFLTLSNVHILESTEARTYSLLTLLTILSLYFFTIVVFEKNQALRYKIGFAITNLLFLYAHLTALPIVVLEWMFMYILAENGKIRREWSAYQGIALAGFLVWFIPFFIGKMQINFTSGWYFRSAEQSNATLLTLLLWGFTNVKDNISITIFSFLLLGLLGYSLSRLGRRPYNYFLLFLAVGALLPPIMSLMLGVAVPKYLLTSYPLLYVFLASGLTALIKNKRQYILSIASMCILLLPGAVIMTTTPVFSWLPMTNYIASNENEHTISLLAFPEDFTFRRYYSGNRPVIPVYLDEDNLPMEERIVRHNWHPQWTTQKEITTWLKKQIDQYHATTIFFIQYSTNYEFIHQGFRQLGWSEEPIPEAILGYYPYGLFVFRAPTNVCSNAPMGTTNN